MKPLLILPFNSYYETQMVRAIDSETEMAMMWDQNGN